MPGSPFAALDGPLLIIPGGQVSSRLRHDWRIRTILEAVSAHSPCLAVCFLAMGELRPEANCSMKKANFFKAGSKNE